MPLLLLFLTVSPALGDTFWWQVEEENQAEVIEGQFNQEATQEGPEIKEPFFTFMVALAEGDSLGTWSAETIAARLESLGRKSRFPIAALRSVARRLAVGLEMESRYGEKVEHIWELELWADMDRPMPYSILGYHPGSLLISHKLVLSEWRLGHLSIQVPNQAGDPVSEQLENVVILRLDEGSIILDVDGWIDALLGSGLDDSWTLGLALARHHGRPLGLAISIGRENRHIFGEIDFQADKVKAHGAPLARALSRHGRAFTAARPGTHTQPWQEDNQ